TAEAAPTTAIVVIERVSQALEDLAEDGATDHPADAAATTVAVGAAPDGATSEASGAERRIAAWWVVAALLLQHTPEPLGGECPPEQLREDGSEDVVVGEGRAGGVVVAAGELAPDLH